MLYKKTSSWVFFAWLWNLFSKITLECEQWNHGVCCDSSMRNVGRWGNNYVGHHSVFIIVVPGKIRCCATVLWEGTFGYYPDILRKTTKNARKAVLRVDIRIINNYIVSFGDVLAVWIINIALKSWLMLLQAVRTWNLTKEWKGRSCKWLDKVWEHRLLHTVIREEWQRTWNTTSHSLRKRI